MTQIAFKRMLLTLPQRGEDYEAVSLTARLASLLGLDLVATFIEDGDLRHVASLPCVRELRPLGGGWRPIDAAQLANELESMALATRRLFEKAVRNSAVEAQFNRARGPISELMRTLASSEDIVVVIEPSNPAERIAQQFTALVEAALKAAAQVMVMPSRVARTKGPVVAIAADHDDPSAHAALAIAKAVNERAILIERQSAVSQKRAQPLPAEPSRRGRRPFDLVSLRHELQQHSESLIVVTRGSLDDEAAFAIAAARGVPVLLIEPAAPDR